MVKTQFDYSDPVARLLTYGDCLKLMQEIKGWPDYIGEIGLGPEHVDDLIHLALDEELREADSESLEVWAPTHAWRALGQLRAEAAVVPLLDMLGLDDDWSSEELPKVYGMIGPVAIDPLKAKLGDLHSDEDARIGAAISLSNIAQTHPEARKRVVAILARQLELLEDKPSLNSIIVAELLVLKAVEAAPAMEAAFAARRVDLMMAGDWGDVQVELGLKKPGEVPQWTKRREGTNANDELLPHEISRLLVNPDSGSKLGRIVAEPPFRRPPPTQAPSPAQSGFTRKDKKKKKR